MKGKIINFRRGLKTQKNNQMIIQVEGITNKEDTKKILKKKIKWVSPAKKEIKGEIKQAHGRNGAVRVHFEKGMPGQSIGKDIEVL